MSIRAFEISVKRFNEFAKEYAKRFENIESYLPSIDKFCDLIIGENPGILELACGPGNITKYIKNRFPESNYLAIDLAPAMLDIARQQVKNVDFRICDIREVSKIDRQFDAILCSFGLPFLSKSDASKLIADCAAKLNNKGVLYISTMEGDESKAGFESTSFSGKTEIYYNYHQQNDLKNAFLESGFVLAELNRQDYFEPDGTVLVDLLFIGIKK